MVLLKADLWSVHLKAFSWHTLCRMAGRDWFRGLMHYYVDCDELETVQGDPPLFQRQLDKAPDPCDPIRACLPAYAVLLCVLCWCSCEAPNGPCCEPDNNTGSVWLFGSQPTNQPDRKCVLKTQLEFMWHGKCLFRILILKSNISQGWFILLLRIIFRKNYVALFVSMNGYSSDNKLSLT